MPFSLFRTMISTTALAAFCCSALCAATTAAVTNRLPPGTIEILGSGPWDNAYSATEATKTRTWVHIRSDAMVTLQPDERLKLWLQWSPNSDGPWKTRSKGEVEVRPKRNYNKPNEHVTLKTRGYVKKDLGNANEATLEMGPLTFTRGSDETETLPYFRVAQAMRRAGESWNRTPRTTLKPEDNHANYSTAFQAKLGIIFAYRPEPHKKHLVPPRYDTINVLAGQPGPWSRLSFSTEPSTCVSFFVGLGGINCGSIIPALPFEVTSPVGQLEFWACHDKPKSYRPEKPKGNKLLDTEWWGVCPVRIPLPPLGESVPVMVRTTVEGKEYAKTFIVFGYTPTPERKAIRKIDKAHYDLLTAQLDPTTPLPIETREQLKAAMIDARQKFAEIRELYRSGKPDAYSMAFANAFITLLDITNKEVLLNRTSDTSSLSKEDQADARLETLLTLSGLARSLQKWHEMSAHLDSYYNAVMEYLANGTLSQEKADHYLKDTFGVRDREPFYNDVDTASFLDLLKEWAWTMSDPAAYQHALDIKEKLLTHHEGHPTSAESQITPQEYRELAQLVMERSGERDRAEALWRKGDDLVLNSESIFFNPKASEKQLRTERPGWLAI